MTMPLSALDLGPAVDTLRLGLELEAAGYRRHWIAEHQPQPQPTLVAALVAQRTERIRIGTAGILLHFYPPSRTASDFRFLARTFPGRIDAGFCRGRVGGSLEVDQLDGRDGSTHMARYPERVAAFVGYIRRGVTRNGEAAPPGPVDVPEIWSLGSGGASAELAAAHGLRFGLSAFHRGSGDHRTSANRYRAGFAPAAAGDLPYVSLAATGVCAESARAAGSIVARCAGRHLQPNVAGRPGDCRDALMQLADRCGADEVVFAAMGTSFEERAAGFRLLAEAWGAS